MPSIFIFLFLLNIAFIFLLSSIDAYLVLLFMFPWTLFIYAILSFKGLRFDSEDEFEELAGKLYWVGKGTFHASIIAIFNEMLSVLIIPDSIFDKFGQQYGIFSPILIIIILPLPGIFILSFKRVDQERLYELIYQIILQEGELPEFVLMTSELFQSTKRFSVEYYDKLEDIKKYVFSYLEENLKSISSFFRPEISFSLNLENLAFFITKKTIVTLDNTDIPS